MLQRIHEITVTSQAKKNDLIKSHNLTVLLNQQRQEILRLLNYKTSLKIRQPYPKMYVDFYVFYF
jgi:hypothetical protein